MPEMTRLLQSIRDGHPAAQEELLSELDRELRWLAASKMARELPGQTLQATALVHEAWLRLVGGDGLNCPNRAYFFAAAGEAMRRILVENARRKNRLKRGENPIRVDVDDVDLPAPMPDDKLLALDAALDRLAESEPRAAEVVKLGFFFGLTHQEAATELGVSLSTIERTWAFAWAWLFQEIKKSQSSQA